MQTALRFTVLFQTIALVLVLSCAEAFGGQLALTNAALIVSVDTSNATFSVLDRRTGRLWTQSNSGEVAVTEAHAAPGEIDLSLRHRRSSLVLQARVALDATQPEFTLSLAGDGAMSGPVRYPSPFLSQPGDRLIVPMNEGISFPVEDKSIEKFHLIAYGGHGICMAFWGVTDEQQGQEIIIETPDDAAIQLLRPNDLLAIAPEWDAQKGKLGYERKLRYVFFDRGGYVAMTKRYREYARQHGLLKTLAEKRSENPNVDLLVGAVNIWNWDADPVKMAAQLREAGIDRILWSRGGSGEALRALNEMKVLTSRYDIYQDTMNPSNFPFLGGTHPDWTTAAWPADIIRQANGDWKHGWGVKGTNGVWYDCGVLCDSRALDYARARIPAELAARPYLCRFIDTTTAAPWNECYDARHPMTRTESRQWKMKLLEYVSRDCKLVTGSETGHDAAAPFVDYFEGMLSLGPFRVPDSGRDMQRIWNDPPEAVAKFQLGQVYRLPLWELVYHDCVVAHWYWGDYNNKLPTLWDKRDLFNVLYGTPPLFMFNRKLWETEKARFVQSYTNTCPYVRAVGYSEMTDHRCLTADRNVQQTAFANGVTVTVNFGTTPFQLATGETLPPGGFRADGMPK
ncbi:MAG: glycoside hydrolase [Limisphaerales bacterium]